MTGCSASEGRCAENPPVPNPDGCVPLFSGDTSDFPPVPGLSADTLPQHPVPVFFPHCRPADFRIDSDAAAEWCLGRILSARRERDHLLALVDAAAADLTDEREKIHRRFTARTDILMSALDAYMQSVPDSRTHITGSRSSYQLLSGRLIRRKGAVRFQRDNDALCDWLAANGCGDLVRTTRTPCWAALKKRCVVIGDKLLIRDTGQAVGGVTVTRTAETFDVEEDPIPAQIRRASAGCSAAADYEA